MTTRLLSREYDLWRRLYTRFSLEPGLPFGNPPELATWILPVTQADRLLESHRAERTDTAVSGNGVIVVATVPAGERWTIRSLRILTASGSFDEEDLRYTDVSNNNTVVTVETWTAAVDHIVENPGALGIVLEETDTISTLISNFAGAGNVTMQAWITVEASY